MLVSSLRPSPNIMQDLKIIDSKEVTLEITILKNQIFLNIYYCIQPKKIMQNINSFLENYLSHYIFKSLWKWTLEGEHIFLVVIVCKTMFSVQERARQLRKSSRCHALQYYFNIFSLLRSYIPVAGKLRNFPD